MDDHYLTLKGRSESLYKVKGSKHFGFAFHVRSEEEIKACLETIRKEHHAARHHAFAWRLGADKAQYRANDDGEPSNSAGKPILGQIQSFDLTDVLIVVVRYFGGTKLGVGGLIDAYRTAARMAIESNEIVEKLVCSRIRVQFPYEAMGEVMRVMNDFNLEMLYHRFEVSCELETEIRESDAGRLIQAFSDIHTVEVL